ncbi:aldose epimerase family protein [Haloferula chungangensis]|uniref:Aldose 1-epimerase n=1 Tax=Haloferula chungangensis TaxID=1048331 RepID=A0ABW2LAN9_9BACT
MLSPFIRMHDNNSAPHMIQAADFGRLADGRSAQVFTLEHPSGMRIRLTDFGATLVSCEIPAADGKLVDLTLGYDSVEGYAGESNPYFGASVGRFGNRIANGRFILDGKEYTLAENNEPNGVACHLHGGRTGFSHVLWTAEPSADGRSVTFSYLSKDGEEGYPGNLNVRVTYTLTEEAELVWECVATTDAPTVLNIINHCYWNLSGDHGTSITDHELTLHADRYLPTSPGMIPTGELAPVTGTPMDFTKPHIIGDRIDADFEALKFGAGYDHCWVLSEPKPESSALAARLKDPKSGRVLEVSTNQPAVQFYAANWVSEELFQGGNAPGKGGAAYGKRSACCLETENFPDAPNQANFPSPVLRPGDTYRHVLIHRFSQE